MKRAILILLCSVSAMAQKNQPAVVLNTLADLDLRYPLYQSGYAEQAAVRGFSVPGDWGAPKVFRYDYTNALSTNAIRRAVRGGVGRWVHDWDADVKAFGAKGDGTTDDTVAAQAAADYAKDNRYDLFFPAGIYRISTLNLGGINVRGVRSGMLRANNGTIIAHTDSPTNHLFILTDDSTVRKPTIQDLILVGKGGLTTPNKVPITGATSRTNLSVALTNKPASHLAMTQQHPIQWAMFYTSEGYWLGSAAVATVATNGSNLDITLVPHTDNYATRDGTTNLLTTSEQLVWAPISGSTSRTDPATAGYCGIYIEQGFSPRISNVLVDKFHTGIYWNDNGTTISPIFDGFVFAHHCEFAGFASRHPVDASDLVVNGTAFVTGSYSAPFASVSGLPTLTETNSVDNAKLRNTSWAFYNAFQVAQCDYLWTDQCVYGAYQANSGFAAIDRLFVDNAIRGGLFFIHGYDATAGGGYFRVDQATFRMPTLADEETYAFLTDKTAVRVNGVLASSETPVNLSFGALELSYNISVNRKWDTGFSINSSGSHKVRVDTAPNTTGATLFYDDLPVIIGSKFSSASEAIVGPYTAATNQWNLAVSGTQVLNVDETDFTFYKPLSLGTDITIGTVDNPSIEWGSSTDGALWVDNSVVNIRGNSNPAFRSHGYQSEPSFKGRRANGTRASPTTVTITSPIAHFDAEAYDGSSYNNVGRLSFIADSTHSSSNRGTYFSVNIVATNTTSRVEAFRVQTPTSTNQTWGLLRTQDGNLRRVGITNNGTVDLLYLIP